MYYDVTNERKNLHLKLILLVGLIVFLLIVGTLVYHFTEGWSVLNSLYFSAISLTTRGYSDMFPSTWFSVIFSIFYLFIGVAILIYSISTLISYYTTFYEKKLNAYLRSKSNDKPVNKWIELRTKKKS